MPGSCGFQIRQGDASDFVASRIPLTAHRAASFAAYIVARSV
jgi:hypothetical protein